MLNGFSAVRPTRGTRIERNGELPRDRSEEEIMMTEEVQRFVQTAQRAMVASTDPAGHPHLALASNLIAPDADHLVFENWFCQTTLRNLEQNPSVAVAILREGSEIGYQLIGRVVHGVDVALLDGYAPGTEPAGEPQALTRLVVRIEQILAFCAGLHTDQPLGS